MREIKFRSWTKEQRDGDTVLPGVMNYDPVWESYIAVSVDKREVESSTQVEVVKSYIAKVNDLFKAESRPNESILMQYTGLKDKNGKEIYEGDILQHDFSPGRTERIICTDENMLALIMKLRNYRKMNDLNDRFEVIGNIYENPELLKGL